MVGLNDVSEYLFPDRVLFSAGSTVGAEDGEMKKALAVAQAGFSLALEV
jgi:hypothetical protein